jgi:hypothetical protein
MNRYGKPFQIILMLVKSEKFVSFPESAKGMPKVESGFG